MKPLKTFLFIMKHGRMRLGLVKRIREAAWINERIKLIYRNWDRKPDFRNPKLVYEVTYLSQMFPDMKNHLFFSFRFHESLLDIGEDAGGVYTIQEYLSSEFPNLPQPPKRAETPKRKFTTTRMQPKTDPPKERTRPSKPYPEPKEKFISFPHKKRKSTDTRIGSKGPNTTFNEAMEEVSDRIEYKMAIQKLSEIAKEYFTGRRSDNPLP